MTRESENIICQEPVQVADSVKNDADQLSQVAQRRNSMDDILAYKLPAFYMDCRGVYGIVVYDYYISCSVNDDNGKYDAKVETLDDQGRFSVLKQRKFFDDPKEAVDWFCFMVRAYRSASKEDLLQEVYDTYGDEW